MSIRMNRIVRALALFAIAVFALLAMPHDARAGSLQIRDEAHVLSQGDVARLRSAVESTPFDARALFTTDYPDAQGLSQIVGSLVNHPNVVAVGVDPSHRHVEVHFGVGTGIPRAAWPAIERAGNASFRNGDWEAGTATIFKAASDAVTTSDRGPLPSTHSPSPVGSGLFLLLAIAAIIGVVAFLFVRRRPPYNMDGGGYGGGPPYGGGYGGGPYGGPAYPGPPAGGMGPVGGGLIGAGLGGLAGYELGKVEGEREEHDREREVEADRTFGRDRDEDYDAGGGGSSWDDGNNDSGSDGGGFDGGGGDSGGGSDF